VAWSVVSSSRHNVEGTFVLRSTCVLVMQVDAPGGVLLHGEPGTGKTLMVRALVEECSRLAGTPVAFFSRKGADCLGTLPLPALRHLSPNYSARSDGPRYRPRRERERERGCGFTREVVERPTPSNQPRCERVMSGAVDHHTVLSDWADVTPTPRLPQASTRATRSGCCACCSRRRSGTRRR
jgi:hypothetical protein